MASPKVPAVSAPLAWVLSELHRGFSWSRHQPSDHQLLRRRPPDRLPLRRRPPDCWVCLGRPLGLPGMASGSARDGLRAVRLNSCPPSEAPFAHPGWMFVLVLVLRILKTRLTCKPRASGVLHCILVHQKPHYDIYMELIYFIYEFYFLK
ncbi:hypothetical protein ILYODFUR_006117 [Ilyodon furcidens]|uniref:Uncharacterized protein n=1 Tax=Ilyodon furcidens TaxID=33524 RepID=A0ABV0USJ1_9TELE